MSDSITYKFFDNNFISVKYRKYKDYIFIYNELIKSGLSFDYDYNYETKFQLRKFQISTVCSILLPAPIIIKIKGMGILNKLFSLFVVSSILFFISKVNFIQGLIEKVITHDSQIGHEARIILKYKIPDHIQIPVINLRLSEYKNRLINTSRNKEQEKTFLNKIISQEEKEEQEFISKIKKNLSKESK